MRANLKRKNLLFKKKKKKTQTNHHKQHQQSKGDEWHNTIEGGQMHRGDAEVSNLIKENLQT